ncbi:lipopolysaccharide biosynthesis protein [Motilibacter aurantiacus]|uniref:lipopolysaccharide biosynthesis protein n=1 Tax=Motilibacter aurantiacus TaxID=2714955 RepID=UPI0014074849|nr:oligosaccharide flippase family protein [Motilibacter aurantiacus]NHC46361.1 oligosaccharide flippase family protein [Motilibacter aurantiacus]
MTVPGSPVTEEPLTAEAEAAALGKERWRRIGLAVVGAAGFRLVTVAGSLVTVPFIHNVLDSEGYALFVLVTQLATLLVFSDLGLGNGLVSPLARAQAQGDREQVRRLVSTAWFLLLAVAAALALLLALVFPHVDWGGLLGAEGPARDDAARAVAVFAALFLTAIPLALAQKVHLALQEGLQANLWQLAGALLGIALTVGCIVNSASVVGFVAAAFAGQTFSAAANCLWLWTRRPWLRPALRLVRRETLGFLGRSGALFLVLGSAAAVAYQTDALVISHLLGAEQVTQYNFTQRVFNLPYMVVAFVMTPLWPAFGDALARADLAWARGTLRKAILLGAVVNVPAAVLLFLAGAPLIRAWTAEDPVSVPTSLLLAFAVWTLVTTFQGPYAMLLNGAHVVRFQVVCSVLMAAANVGLSIALTRALGVAGPVWGTVIAQLVFITVPSAVYVRRRLWSPVSPAQSAA